MLFDELAQGFYIHNKTGVCIGPAFYGYMNFIVVAMPVVIGTKAKHGFVLLPAPGRIVELVGSVEVFHPS
jgi:hypothetical protein